MEYQEAVLYFTLFHFQKALTVFRFSLNISITIKKNFGRSYIHSIEFLKGKFSVLKLASCFKKHPKIKSLRSFAKQTK